MPPLTSLPPEIFNLVLLNLDPASILNLSECIAVTITAEVYHHAFLDNSYFPVYDLEMFKARVAAKFYLIGLNGDHGYFKDWNRVGTLGSEPPYQVESRGIVVQANISESKICVLNSYGELLGSESFSVHFSAVQGRREGDEDNYQNGRAAKRRREQTIRTRKMLESMNIPVDHIEDVVGDALPPPTPSLIAASERLFSQPYQPTRFRKILGNQHYKHQYVTDINGLIWVFEDSWNQKTYFFPVLDGEGKQYTKGIAYYDSGAVHFFDGSGISKGCYPQQTLSANGRRSGYDCVDDNCCYADVVKVPGTEDVQSFGTMLGPLICLRKNGSVCAFDRPRETTSIGTEMRKVNKLGPFVALHVAYGRLGLICPDGRVIIVDHGPEKVSISGTSPFEGLVVASLAMTRNDILALTTDGEVYRLNGEGKAVRLDLPKRAWAVYVNDNYIGVMM